MEQAERRRYARSGCRLLIELHGDDFQIYTNATDLALEGAFVNTLYLVEEGSDIEIKVPLVDSSDKLELKAKVVRHAKDFKEKKSKEGDTFEDFGMAIKFVDIPETAKPRLKALVADFNA